MNTTKAAAHIRNRIKHAGIKARVAPGGGMVQVNAPAFDVVFDAAAQREIRLIAKVNGFTWARGMVIDIDQMTNPSEFNFHAGK